MTFEWDSQFDWCRTLYVHMGKWILSIDIHWTEFAVGLRFRPSYPACAYIDLICIQIGLSNG